jgi:hypothetical protein
MSKDLTVFKEDQLQGVLIIREGQPQTVSKDRLIETLNNLSPSDILDFVLLPEDVQILVIGDEHLGETQIREIFGDEARFLKSEELPARAESWKLPMTIPSLLKRAVENGRDELDGALRHAGVYLESHTRHKELSPWQKGLVAASVRAVWDAIKKEGLAAGESHWGWLRSYMMGNGDEAEWDSEKGKLEAYMRAADVMVRNVEKRGWIANLTLSQILSVPISKVIICCGAISDGIFDFSYKLQARLLDSVVPNNDMRHLIAQARRHEDEIPIQSVDKETGEITYVRPCDGEIVDEPDEPILDQYLPDMDLGVDTSKPKHGRPLWTYDQARKTFKHWDEGGWVMGLAVVSNDIITKQFVNRIIAQCGVRADYDSEEREDK